MYRYVNRPKPIFKSRLREKRLMGNLRKKRGPLKNRALRDVKVKTSRGEQLLRWYWEEEDHHVHQLNWIWESAAETSMARAKNYYNYRYVFEIWAKKRGPQEKLGPFIVMKVIKPPEGEQLLRWHWEEKSHQVCISCSRYDGFLGRSQSFNMHDSHVPYAPLRNFQAISACCIPRKTGDVAKNQLKQQFV